jgi:hypothetical protein
MAEAAKEREKTYSTFVEDVDGFRPEVFLSGKSPLQAQHEGCTVLIWFCTT